MKIIICFRHLKCICHKWRKGTDYSWHVQNLLREFGCGHFADRGRVPALSKAFADAGAKAYVTVAALNGKNPPLALEPKSST
jgi:hypothetical protein